VASVHGPYPTGNASAQPVLRFAFPSAETGARDQTLRLIVQPDIWGPQTRLRLSNAMGTKPVTFDGVFAGLQMSGAAIVAGTNRPVSFGGKPGVTVPPGESVWSDTVRLPYVTNPPPSTLPGRKLAVSLHVAGESGPMTWHAKALTTSYLTAPGDVIEVKRRWHGKARFRVAWIGQIGTSESNQVGICTMDSGKLPWRIKVSEPPKSPKRS